MSRYLGGLYHNIKIANSRFGAGIEAEAHAAYADLSQKSQRFRVPIGLRGRQHPHTKPPHQHDVGCSDLITDAFVQRGGGGQRCWAQPAYPVDNQAICRHHLAALQEHLITRLKCDERNGVRGDDGLVGQATQLGRETWVTAAPQVQSFCQSYAITPETPLTLHLEQLLGLPANNGKTRFVEMWVNPDDMLRPSPDGEVDDMTAELEMPGPDHFSSQQDYEFHRDWFNLQMSLQAYDDPSKGYPWTRLGYTYDWGNPESEVGLSEFVVAAGATVVIEAVSTLETYCAP